LRQLARERQIDIQLLLTTYGIQRFLHRLGKTEHASRYVLKGAQLLQTLAVEHTFRPTRDVDLAARGDPGVAILRQSIVELAELDQPDGLEFDLDSLVIEEIREQMEYGGWRARMNAYLDGARIPLRLDVGFGDALVPEPVPIRMRALLDMPAAEILGYAAETVVAEKLQALTALGLLNSRLKDYFDLWFIANHVHFDEEVLVDAVVSTFARRDTPINTSPSGLTEAYWSDEQKQRMWRGFLNTSAATAPSLEEVCRYLRVIYLPLLERAYR
jgi:hypothetical protein